MTASASEHAAVEIIEVCARQLCKRFPAERVVDVEVDHRLVTGDG
jgi:hypothetical protein